MNWLLAFFSNKVFVVSAGSWLIAQVLKTIINFILTKELKLERLVGAGGMPSCHSATVCSLATMTGFVCGVDSAEFAIATMVAIIVMYDARGVRQETGKQAKALNQLKEYFQKVSQGATPHDLYPDLKELVGHTMYQVIAGAMLGILTGTLAGVLWK